MNLICFIIVILIGFPVILVFADSEIEDKLLNEGNVLFTQGKYFEALTYYDQILNLNPEHEIAKNNLMESFDNLSYNRIDGLIEIIVRDSDGHLVTYLKSTHLEILNDEFAEKFLNEWTVQEVITRDGQDFEVLQTTKLLNIEKNLVVAYDGFIISANTIKIGLLHAKFNQILLEKGDTINYFYTYFRPIE